MKNIPENSPAVECGRRGRQDEASPERSRIMQLPQYFEFHDRTKIVYGPGTIKNTGEEAQKLGGAKALVVTDQPVKKLGLADKVMESLEKAGLETALLIDDIPQDSDAELVQEIYGRAEAAGADFCVAVGGGSVIDTTKMVNLLLTEGGDLMKDHQGTYLQTRPLKPMIAIPTTAGTGSEVTFAAVIKSKAQKMKVSFISHFFAPSTAILDPDVTLTLPPGLTAGTGMDAFTHAVESMHSLQAQPVADALAMDAIRRIYEYLPKAVEDGQNREARGQMLIAACVAGLAFSNALVGIVHGIAHSVGAIAGVPHGLANSIILPHGMEFNIDFCTEKYAMAARAMGLAPGGDARADAEAAIEKTRGLIACIGLPARLSEVGVSEDQLEAIADTTMGDGTVFTNPRMVTDPAEVLDILKKAF